MTVVELHVHYSPKERKDKEKEALTTIWYTKDIIHRDHATGSGCLAITNQLTRLQD